MSPALAQIIEMARRHKITPKEHDAQVRSFVYGNIHFENPSIPRADVDQAVESLKGTSDFSSPKNDSEL